MLGSEQVPFANCKIGPAAPPVRTESGWLATFHAVYKHEYDLPSWHSGWRKEYRVGLVLLDLDEPWRVIGMARAPLMIPDPAYRYEVEGFRGYAIFPGGMLMRPDGAVWLYYGAADTVEAVAFGRLDEWVRACLDGSGDG